MGMERVSSLDVAVAAGDARPRFGRILLRQVVPLAAAVLFLVLLRDRILAIDLGAVRAALGQIGAMQWVGAGLAIVASFAAITRYDIVVHRHLRTGAAAGEAAWAGFSAIAISQVLGLGLITGALVRWRMLPGLGLWQATRLTATVTAFFLLGWAVVTAAAVLILPGVAPLLAMPVVQAGAAAILSVAVLALGAVFWHPRIAGRDMPSLGAISRLLTLTLADTVAAALALWALMPDGIVLGPADLIPAYLLALGAGLVLATPGGLGAFEVALLALLPSVPAEPLLAAIVAYRLIYFALPAALAALILIRGPGERVAKAGPGVIAPDGLQQGRAARQIAGATRSEWGIARQGQHEALVTPGARDGWLIGQTGQALVALFDPFRGDETPFLIAALSRAAKDRNRIACLYKCSARTAVHARQAGYSVWPVAEELWLDPAEATGLAGAARAGLRRKLRKAANAGLRIERGRTGALPLAAMARVAAGWATHRGGERGFSMGRFAPDYVAGQRVYLGWLGDRLVAFVTFHEGATEWGLDLMRFSAGAPDGTMQALVAAALEDAALQKMHRVSLAALPCPPGRWPLPPPLARAIQARSGCSGLSQFKIAFAPRRTPLYIAAPNLLALTLAAADLAREIHRPAPLPWQHTDRTGQFTPIDRIAAGA
ncbi:MAG: phosphatidylglycerol lysyltransferase domain-containing protein, partial [Albidovulum sp.]|uniref:phosphatidylglycerol lysyltransferase domain-containing protein n=1 Tax=Albidovulum sp. TaxID=1872424 RepID=UPI003CB54E7D